MTDPIFLTALICIGTACILSFLLGRYLGMSAAFESLRPLLPSDEMLDADCRVTGLANELFHSAPVTEGRQRHHGC